MLFARPRVDEVDFWQAHGNQAFRALWPTLSVCSSAWYSSPGMLMLESAMAVTQDMLDRIVTSLVDEAGPERIVLFGSQARDDVDADSDIDLLVVERQPFGPGRSRRKEMARLWRALPQLTVGTDILVYSSDEVERWRGSRNHVVGKALYEGRVLYERP